jgi:HEAT repeat protein
MRLAVATALGKVGRGAKDAIPALVKRQNDESFAVRRAAAKALRAIDPET